MVVRARVAVLALTALLALLLPLLSACGRQLAGSAVAAGTRASGIDIDAATAVSPSSRPAPAAPSSAAAASTADSAAPPSSTGAGTSTPANRLELSVTAGVVLDPAARKRVAEAARDLLAAGHINATVSVVPPDRIAVVADTDDARILGVLGGARRLEWLPVRAAAPAQPAACDRPPTPGHQCDVAGHTSYQLGEAPFQLAGVTAVTARAAAGQGGGWVVQFAVDARTRTALAEYTAANTGKPVALSDGLRVITAATISAPIPGGRLAISGTGSQRDARAIAARITLAALKVEIAER
jgi:preprotein translocase subunit SecD